MLLYSKDERTRMFVEEAHILSRHLSLAPWVLWVSSVLRSVPRHGCSAVDPESTRPPQSQPHVPPPLQVVEFDTPSVLLSNDSSRFYAMCAAAENKVAVKG